MAERKIKPDRICQYFDCEQSKIDEFYKSVSLDSQILLKWSKFLGYDFFRVYSQHLILYAPVSAEVQKNGEPKENSALPQFRKNIYTKEIIEFILEQIDGGEKTIQEVIREYNLPKTTVYKWVSKYKKLNDKN